MKVLVCGGRDFLDGTFVDKTLAAVHQQRQITRIIHGGARGADTLAGLWANRQRIDESVYPADWKAHGKAAGSIRNVRMLEESEPDMVVAFPGGTGTAHMVALARAAGLYVMEPVEREEV